MVASFNWRHVLTFTMYHLDVVRDTQFGDVTEDSNRQEFETRTQPMGSLFSHYISQYTKIIS